MTREEAIRDWIIPAISRTWNDERCKEILEALEQEPCDDVCEWFEQYVDIATDIVELRFSDGTVKRAKRGLYMRDIEKSIRKMLIDQIANEKKQEPRWIPVSERLPENDGDYLLFGKVVEDDTEDTFIGTYDACVEKFGYWKDYYDKSTLGFLDSELIEYNKVIAWMPLPEPYKASPTGAEGSDKE